MSLSFTCDMGNKTKYSSPKNNKATSSRSNMDHKKLNKWSQTDAAHFEDSNIDGSDKFKILQLQTCKLKNVLDDKQLELDEMSKTVNVIKEKNNLLSKQLDLSNDIIERNEKLKDEIVVLREKSIQADKLLLQCEDQKNIICDLKQQIEYGQEIMKENHELKQDLEQAKEKEMIAKNNVQRLVNILSRCPSRRQNAPADNMDDKESTKKVYQNSAETNAQIYSQNRSNDNSDSNFNLEQNHPPKKFKSNADYNNGLALPRLQPNDARTVISTSGRQKNYDNDFYYDKRSHNYQSNQYRGRGKNFRARGQDHSHV